MCARQTFALTLHLLLNSRSKCRRSRHLSEELSQVNAMAWQTQGLVNPQVRTAAEAAHLAVRKHQCSPQRRAQKWMPLKPHYQHL